MKLGILVAIVGTALMVAPVEGATPKLRAPVTHAVTATPATTTALTATASTTTPPADLQPSFPVRAAFYYPWFPEAWTQKGIYPYTRYTPSLGFYDSGSTAVIQQHIQAMQYGKIQVGIASWWGQGSKTDSRLGTLLSTTGQMGSSFRWTIYYEPEGQGDPSVSQITSDLVYVRDHYGSDPSYFRINGRFVVFVYADVLDGCAMADRWRQANTVSAYVVLKVFSGYRLCASQPDGWHQYAPAVAEDSQAGYSFSVSPGFYKADESTPRLARDLSRWNQNVRDAVASNAPFQLVTTFNEWGEGTAVESAQEWATSSGFGGYLDALHNDGQAASDTSPPSQPGSLAVTGTTDTSVTLAWLASSDDVGVDHYEIDRNGVAVGTTTSTGYTDRGLQPLTLYHYAVVALDAAGNRSAAATVDGTTAADATPPSAPTNLTASAAGATQVNLAWTASTDDVGVSGYHVFRDGGATALATVTSGTSYQDTGLAAGSTHSYTVSAFDAAGNESARSSPASATTSSGSTTTTFRPVVDAYVDSSHPSSNYGSSTALRVDGSPKVRSYLKFSLTGLSGTVTKVSLRLYATSSQSTGYDVFSVSETSWTETGITGSNAPAPAASKTGSSGKVSKNTWTTVDVTSLVAGNGTISIALTTPSSTALSLSSREGANPPQLVVTTS